MSGRQQPRLERSQLGSPEYLGRRAAEIYDEYRPHILPAQEKASWLRAWAAALNSVADDVEAQVSLF